jgi:ribosomal protein S18 acetylase RimI-like enzyme
MTQTQETRTPLAVTVRKARMAEVPTLIDVMARAFDDDPIANFFAAQDEKRQDRIRNMMAVGLRKLTMPYNETYTTEDLLGAAQWTPPGKWKLGMLQQIFLIPSMVRTTSVRRLPKVMGGLAAIEKKHPHEPHFYLLALGVEPEYQGRGVGTSLMRPVLERCDRERIPAYLESSKERNVPLYERNGFRVTEEMVVPNGGPKIWLMWRDPQ